MREIRGSSAEAPWSPFSSSRLPLRVALLVKHHLRHDDVVLRSTAAKRRTLHTCVAYRFHCFHVRVLSFLLRGVGRRLSYTMCLFDFNIDSRSGTSWDTCLRLQTYCAEGTVRIHAKMAPRKGPRQEALKTCPAEATFRGAEGPRKGSTEGNKFP